MLGDPECVTVVACDRFVAVMPGQIWNLVKSDCRDGEALLLRTVSLLPTDSPGDAIAHDDLGRVTSAIAVTTNRNIWPVGRSSAAGLQSAVLQGELGFRVRKASRLIRPCLP